MPSERPAPLTLRLPPSGGAPALDLPAILRASGAQAQAQLAAYRGEPGVHVLLAGDRDYLISLRDPADPEVLERLQAQRGHAVSALFKGRSGVRRRVAEIVSGDLHAAAEEPASAETPAPAPPVETAALDLTGGLSDAAPLYLLPSGSLATAPTGPAPTGMEALETLVTAARWISTRRASTFEQLFPPSAFHPDIAARTERLSAAQAISLLAQVRSALTAAAVGGTAAAADAEAAAQLRSAALTVLSHVVGTVRKDPSFRTAADESAELIFSLIDQEVGSPAARPALRSHAIQLLQMRAPALSPAQRQRAKVLLGTLLRAAPPYDELKRPWRFAMCSAWDFHEGECQILVNKYKFKEIQPPADAPVSRAGRYRVFEAPFSGTAGQPIQIFTRVATPSDENAEMAEAGFIGLLINRHAQLGSFDMQASASEVKQSGYKLMMNTQCAGLTTRFAIAKMFPEADIYSSWDSTYFQTDRSGTISASEGLDCFVAVLNGMSRGETHAQLSERIERAQWYHEQGRTAGFVQFVGPGHPLVVARYSDVNQDGRADYYDGFLDFALREIQIDVRGSATPRDPGVAASQVGGDAAKGLGWAVGSLNRVTQYSDLWRGLPGDSELFYIFESGGYYSQREPPQDVPAGTVPPEVLKATLGTLPSVCRYRKSAQDERALLGVPAPELAVDVMMHSYLSHSAWELKRLLCAAEAQRRALDLGYLPPTGQLATLIGQRGALLLMLAGLLEFPADQNFIDGLWNMALAMLNLPPISRSLVRGCITHEDHDASNYYGSVRGLRQLVGDADRPGAEPGGALYKADPVAYEKLKSADPLIGRSLALVV